MVAGLAAAQLVSSVLYRSEALGAPDATLVGLTPPAAVAAVLVASTGLALLLAGAPPRPLAVVAALLGVAAAATVAEEALLWWLFGSRTTIGEILRFLTVHALVGFLTAAGLVAFAVGVRRPAGSLAREAAVGAIVLWGAVVVALRVLSPSVWQAGRPYGTPQAALDPAEPYSLGVLTLLAAPAAALLVARMRARPGREAVTMRWRGACTALALLLFAQVTMPLALLLIMWPGQALLTRRLVLWMVLSGAAAVGFSLAALRRDAGPVIAVVAALLAVSSVGLGPVGGLWAERSGPLLGEPLVLGMLAPLVVALAVAFRALSARRGRDDADPSGPADSADPAEPTGPTEPAVPV